MPDISLIPFPRFCRRNKHIFRLTPETVLMADTGEAAAAATLLRDIMLQDTGLALPIADRPGAGGVIRLSGGTQTAEDEAGFRGEAYHLTITDAAVDLVADTPDGLAAGIQTLRQLLPEGAGTLPGLEIRDEPHYRWRGMLLDSSRHFFTVDEVCRLVELMALHKFNVLHWHLTDDQGWRLEIERFPLLTRIGSRRACTQTNHNTDRPILYDDRPHGGFYTRSDIRHVVEFAARRGIRIMPEIDLPGHAESLLAAYPEFGNLPGYRYRVRERWGISRHTLNVAPETIAAIEASRWWEYDFPHMDGQVTLDWTNIPKTLERIAKAIQEGRLKRLPERVVSTSDLVPFLSRKRFFFEVSRNGVFIKAFGRWLFLKLATRRM